MKQMIKNLISFFTKKKVTRKNKKFFSNKIIIFNITEKTTTHYLILTIN